MDKTRSGTVLDGARRPARPTDEPARASEPVATPGPTLPPEPAPEPAPEPEPVGERLRAARLDAGLTLEQVSATTRIRVPVLRDLEADRLGSAGTAVYTRGHVRAIAAAVGVDPAPLVRALDARLGAAAPSLVVVPDTVPVPRSPRTPLPVPVSAPPERQSPRWLSACLIGAAVLVALLGVDALTDGEGDPAPVQALTTPQAVETAVPQQAAQVPSTAGSAGGPSAATLVLEAKGRSWLSVRNRGGVRLFEGQVEAGWTRRFDDPVVLSVRVGNAAAVVASCAGAPAQVLGAEDVALTLRCTPEGVPRP